MKLSSKLAISIGSGIFGLFAVSAVSLFEIERVHATTIAFADKYLPTNDAQGRILLDLTKIKSLALEMVFTTDPGELEYIESELATSRHGAKEQIQHYETALINDQTDRNLFTDFKNKANTVDRQLDTQLALIRQNNPDKAKNIWPIIAAQINQAYDALQAEMEYNDHLAATSRAESDRSYDKALQNAFLLSSIVIFLMIALAVWAYRGVADPLRFLEKMLIDMESSLDMSRRVNIKASAEVSEAVKALNRFLARAQSNMQAVEVERDRASFDAMHDQLTGLFLWRTTCGNLDMAIERADCLQHKVALMFIDLDGFKAINDTFGHDAGDCVLKVVSTRILSSLRADDIASRKGGDEFLVILGGLADTKPTQRIARELIEKINLPVEYEGHSLRVGASIGIAIFPDHAADSLSILKAADEAMYAVKRCGKNRFAYFGEGDAAGNPDIPDPLPPLAS